jgi:uncharacterized protein YqgC (DUF456 family)
MTIGDISISKDLILAGFTLGIMLVGLFGLIIPILPGLVIIWFAALGYGLFAGFEVRGWVLFAVITLLMIAGELAEHVLMGALALKQGVPWWVVLIVLGVAIAGNMVVPFLGGILAGLLALFVLEWLRSRDAKKALARMLALLVGFALGFCTRFMAGLGMIGSWSIWAFAG